MHYLTEVVSDSSCNYHAYVKELPKSRNDWDLADADHYSEGVASDDSYYFREVKYHPTIEHCLKYLKQEFELSDDKIYIQAICREQQNKER